VILYNIFFTSDEEGFAMSEAKCRGRAKNWPDAWDKLFESGKQCEQYVDKWNEWRALGKYAHEVEGDNSSNSSVDDSSNDSSSRSEPIETVSSADRSEYLELAGRMQELQNRVDRIRGFAEGNNFQRWKSSEMIDDMTTYVREMDTEMRAIWQSLVGALDEEPTQAELQGRYASSFHNGWFVTIYNLNEGNINIGDNLNVSKEYTKGDMRMKMWNVEDLDINETSPFVIRTIQGEETKETSINVPRLVMSGMGYIPVDEEMELELRINGGENSKLMYKVLTGSFFANPHSVKDGPWLMAAETNGNSTSERIQLSQGSVLLLRFDQHVHQGSSGGAIEHRTFMGSMASSWSAMEGIKNCNLWKSINAGSVGILNTSTSDIGGFKHGMAMNFKRVLLSNGTIDNNSTIFPHVLTGVNKVNVNTGNTVGAIGYKDNEGNESEKTSSASNNFYHSAKFFFVAQAGTYGFRYGTDDGSRIKMRQITAEDLSAIANGENVQTAWNNYHSSWRLQGTTWYNGADFTATAGQIYEVYYEFYEWGGHARSTLQWKTPSNGSWHIIESPNVFCHPNQLLKGPLEQEYLMGDWVNVTQNNVVSEEVYLPPLNTITFEMKTNKSQIGNNYRNVFYIYKDNTGTQNPNRRTPAIWIWNKERLEIFLSGTGRDENNQYNRSTHRQNNNADANFVVGADRKDLLTEDEMEIRVQLTTKRDRVVIKIFDMNNNNQLVYHQNVMDKDQTIQTRHADASGCRLVLGNSNSFANGVKVRNIRIVANTNEF
jgi:hypothetical protein